MTLRRTGRSRDGTIAAILFWLGVGVTANVLATWGIAVWQAGVVERPRAGARIDVMLYPGSAGNPSSPAYGWTARSRLWLHDRIYWAMNSGTGVEHVRYGMPWRSLQCWQAEAGHTRVWRFSVELPMPARANGATMARLPLFPVWPGFALNTLFYAALAWMLWQLPLALRRRRRRSKGLCVRCGYDRKGIGEEVVCPECGGIPGAAR